MDVRHVPDLEQCQELDRLCKEKNITLPETEYIWLKWKHHEEPWLLSKSEEAFYQEQGAKKPEWTIPAPLVSELGEWLPWSIDTGCVNFDNCPSWHRVTYYRGEHYLEQTASTEANARQKMLNYLIVERIITTL